MIRNLKSKTFAAYSVFFVSAAVWVAAAGLPEGLFRTISVIALAIAFAGAFLWLLVIRLRGVFDEEAATERELVKAGVNLLILLAVFAAVYTRLGIVNDSDPEQPLVRDYGTAAYYSVVTFTTLGYGDYRPIDVGRAVAGIEAFTGYFVLAVIASTAAEIIKSQGRNRSEQRANSRDR